MLLWWKIWSNWCTGHINTTTTPPQPFYGPFSWTTRVSRCQKRNFWTLWCKGRLTEADTETIGLESGLTNAHVHHPPFFTGRMPFLLPNQQCQSTEGNWAHKHCSRKIPATVLQGNYAIWVCSIFCYFLLNGLKCLFVTVWSKCCIRQWAEVFFQQVV